MSSFLSKLSAKRVKVVARKTNNELSNLPGFFFKPKDTEGLEELTFEHRAELLANQGNRMVDFYKEDPSMKQEMLWNMENSRIPTHRRPGTPIPAYGKVPFDLREVIEVK